MSERRTPWVRVLAWVVSWVVVVAAGSTLVWLVIARAGEGVVPSRADAGGTVGVAPDPTDRATGSGRPTGPSTPGSAGTGAPTDAASPDTTDPTSSDTEPADPPPPAEQRRTWSGQGGNVTAVCRGSSITLESASPDPGWTAERDDDGSELRVRFELAQEHGEDDRTEVEARCSGGVPVFSVDTD